MIRATLGCLLVVIGATPVGAANHTLVDRLKNPVPINDAGDSVSVETRAGRREKREVARPAAEVHVELAGAERAEVGRPYELRLTVQNESAVPAKNVRVRVSVSAARANEAAIDVAKVVRFGTGGSLSCAVYERDRVCAIGDLAPNETKSGDIRFDVGPSAPPGRLTFGARVRGDNTANGGKPESKVVALAPAAAQPPVNVALTVKRDTDVTGPGKRFGYLIDVENKSAQPAADVELDIRQRLGVRERGKLQPFERGLRDTIVSAGGAACTVTTPSQYRCRLGTIPPNEIRRVTVEAAVVRDLAQRQWGRHELQARVRRGEQQTTLAFAKSFTNVVSRVPEVAVFGRGRDEPRDAEIKPVTAIAHGQLFGIAARFMDAAVDPTGGELRVRVTPRGHAPFDVTLSQGAGGDGVFRSGLFRLLAPGDASRPEDQGVRELRVQAGAFLHVVYDPAGDTPGTETTVAVVAPRTTTPRGPGGEARQ